MVAGSRRMLMLFSTAPGIGTPKCASSMGGVFGSMTATVSPGPMPRPASAAASLCARARNAA